MVAIIITILLSVPRILGYTGTILKAFQHIWFGYLIGTKKWWAATGFVLVELVMATVAILGGMNYGESLGIVLMVYSLLITIGILLYDWLWLAKRGKPTISWQQWVKLRQWWSGNGPFPWLVIILPVGVAIQAIGLLIHFLAGLRKGGLQK